MSMRFGSTESAAHLDERVRTCRPATTDSKWEPDHRLGSEDDGTIVRSED
ncbi:hypothetical protein [uncultured Streptomyces sp.]|nr:hypothetical protein [uncultured Streptomyces sp.]